MPTSPPAGAPRAGFFGRAILSARGMRSVSHSRTSSPVHDSVRQTYTLRAASHRIAKAHPPLARPGDLGIVTTGSRRIVRSLHEAPACGLSGKGPCIQAHFPEPRPGPPPPGAQAAVSQAPTGPGDWVGKGDRQSPPDGGSARVGRPWLPRARRPGLPSGAPYGAERAVADTSSDTLVHAVLRTKGSPPGATGPRACGPPEAGVYCGLRIADCGLRISDFGFRISEMRIPSRTAPIRIPQAGYLLDSTTPHGWW